jgi:hypothetical protein
MYKNIIISFAKITEGKTEVTRKQLLSCGHDHTYVDSTRLACSHAGYLSEGDGSGTYKVLKPIPETMNCTELRKQAKANHTTKLYELLTELTDIRTQR